MDVMYINNLYEFNENGDDITVAPKGVYDYHIERRLMESSFVKERYTSGKEGKIHMNAERTTTEV